MSFPVDLSGNFFSWYQDYETNAFQWMICIMCSSQANGENVDTRGIDEDNGNGEGGSDEELGESDADEEDLDAESILVIVRFPNPDAGQPYYTRPAS